MTHAAINTQTLTIPAADGYPLAATRFTPAASAASGAPASGATIVLPCAMGVRQSFYYAFAHWLAEQGHVAITFDYRGMGDSAPASLKGFAASVTDWATKDYNAVLRWAKQDGARPLFVVGHSLGGQLPGLLPDAGLIDGLVTVASGNGYWRYNAPQTRRVVPWLWWVLVPVLTRVYGYFPGKRLRKLGDLLEWRRWCLHRDYVAGVGGEPVRAGYRRIACPMLSVSFTDDEMMTDASIRTLNACYANARLETRRIAPYDVGVPRIGHFGFFREQFRATLWPQVAGWIGARLNLITETS
jgi:predicted alpha/beta hydrolase